MKIFFFGGTFDPPHLGHEKIVDFCLDNCDKLVIIPNKNSLDKIKTTDANHRLNMLKLLFNNKRIIIDEFELESKKPNYTYYTIEYLKNIYKDDLTMVIGYDQLINIDNWFNFKEILEDINILCFNRKVSNRVKNNKFRKLKNIKYIEKFNYNISSSKIRKKIINSKNESYKKNLNHEVIKYIKMNKLYEY